METEHRPRKVNTIYAITSGSRKNWEAYRKDLKEGDEFTISTLANVAPRITISTMLGAQKRGEVVLVSKCMEKREATWRYLNDS